MVISHDGGVQKILLDVADAVAQEGRLSAISAVRDWIGIPGGRTLRGKPREYESSSAPSGAERKLVPVPCITPSAPSGAERKPVPVLGFTDYPIPIEPSRVRWWYR